VKLQEIKSKRERERERGNLTRAAVIKVSPRGFIKGQIRIPIGVRNHSRDRRREKQAPHPVFLGSF